MLFKQLISTTLAATAVYGQTYTSCDPLEKSCPADPALGGSLDVNFASNGESDRFKATVSSDKISYNSKGCEMTISEKGNAPTLTSDFYIMFGRVDVTVQVAPGTGIVTSFVLQSDDLDEIDIEWLGGDTTQFQSNYFSKGDTSTYDRGAFHAASSPQTNFYTYSIVWTDTQLQWIFEGNVVRTLPSTNAEGYPQTPMAIKMGTWAGGDSSNAAGTIEWAGGATDYSAGPFNAYFKEIKVQDYSTGSEYSYSDKTGSWTSITAKDGKVNGNADGSSSSSSSSSSSASSSAASSAVSSSSSSAVSSSSSSATSSVASSVTSSVTSSVASSAASSATTSSTTGSTSPATSSVFSSAAASSTAASSTAVSSITLTSATSTAEESSAVASGSATTSTTGIIVTSGVVPAASSSQASNQVAVAGVSVTSTGATTLSTAIATSTGTAASVATQASTASSSHSSASASSSITEANGASKNTVGLALILSLFAVQFL